LAGSEEKRKVQSMSFFLWKSSYLEGFCVITAPRGVDKMYQLNQGIARADGFPSDVTCHMTPDFPKDVQLCDNLYGAGFIIISKPLREALENEQVNNVEFLPIQIINHKGRTASTDYFLVNPLDVYDCIDIDKSGVTWNAITKNRIDYCKGLVLRDDQIPSEALIFRPRFWTNLVVVRNKLVERLAKAGFSGLIFQEPEKHKA
jgi:hypothetical protein